MSNLKTTIRTEASWYELIDAVSKLSNKIANELPEMFSRLDAERLEAIAKMIRNKLESP